jgi:hypothetical protein
MREAGLKSVIVWLPKEGADRLARYPEKERGEVITRALALLESQGVLTGNGDTITGKLTGEARDEGEAKEDTLTLAGLLARLERVEAILSIITSNSTGKLTGEGAIITGESTRGFIGNEPPEPTAALTGESTDKSTGNVEPSTKLPHKRIPALVRKAKNLRAQGVSWEKIAKQWNDQNTPTITGIGRWRGPTVKLLMEKHGTK